jgi:hypothetical protein
MKPQVRAVPAHQEVRLSLPFEMQADYTFKEYLYSHRCRLNGIRDLHVAVKEIARVPSRAYIVSPIFAIVGSEHNSNLWTITFCDLRLASTTCTTRHLYPMNGRSDDDKGTLSTILSSPGSEEKRESLACTQQHEPKGCT